MRPYRSRVLTQTPMVTSNINVMKKCTFVLFASLPILLWSCGGGNSDSNAADSVEATPGPVSEMDKSRYNLNSTDEPLYGTTDTLKQDSLQKADSLKKANP